MRRSLSKFLNPSPSRPKSSRERQVDCWEHPSHPIHLQNALDSKDYCRRPLLRVLVFVALGVMSSEFSSHGSNTEDLLATILPPANTSPVPSTSTVNYFLPRIPVMSLSTVSNLQSVSDLEPNSHHSKGIHESRFASLRHPSLFRDSGHIGARRNPSYTFETNT